MSLTKNFIKPFLLTGLLFGLAGNASAQQGNVVWAGMDTKEDSIYGYFGGVHAFNNDLGQSGFLARIGVGVGNTEYSTVAVASGNVDDDQWRVNGAIGYQWMLQAVRLSLYGGVDYNDHELDPNDISNSVNDGETGGLVQGELETRGTPIYAGAIASYSTAFDTYWVRGRLGYQFSNFGNATFGPEIVVSGNENHDEQRYGGFVKWSLTDQTGLQVSGGYASSEADGSRRDEDSAYGAVGVSFAF